MLAFFWTTFHPATIRVLQPSTAEVLWESEYSVSTVPKDYLRPVAVAEASHTCEPVPNSHLWSNPSGYTLSIPTSHTPKEDLVSVLGLPPPPPLPPPLPDQLSEAPKAKPVSSADQKPAFVPEQKPQTATAPRDRATEQRPSSQSLSPTSPTSKAVLPAAAVAKQSPPSLEKLASPPDSPTDSRTGARRTGGLLPPPTEDMLQKFAQKWNLDANSRKFLKGLPGPVQAAVVSGFRASETTHCVNALMHAYACSVARKLASSPETFGALDQAMDQFIGRWHLDDEARSFIRELPPEVQFEVIIGFHPKEGTPDYGALLRNFARSVATNLGKRGTVKSTPSTPLTSPTSAGTSTQSKATPSTPTTGSTAATVTSPPSEAKSTPAKRGGAASPVAAEGNHESPESLQEFSKRFELGASTLAMLNGLPVSVRGMVIAGFKPKTGTRNIEALLHGYAASIAQRQGLTLPGGLPPPMPSSPTNAGSPTAAGVSKTDKAEKPKKASTPTGPKTSPTSADSRRTVQKPQGFGFALLQEGSSSEGESEAKPKASVSESPSQTSKAGNASPDKASSQKGRGQNAKGKKA